MSGTAVSTDPDESGGRLFLQQIEFVMIAGYQWGSSGSGSCQSDGVGKRDSAIGFETGGLLKNLFADAPMNFQGEMFGSIENIMCRPGVASAAQRIICDFKQIDHRDFN